MTKAFLQYWVIVLLSGVFFFWLQYYGFFSLIYKSDPTYICLVTFLIYIGATIFVGLETFRLNALTADAIAGRTHIGWMIPDICMAMGLFGTVIGCIIMFSSNFAGVGAGDQAAMLGLIQNISHSFGIALYTTATGITTAVLLRLQMSNLQHFVDKYEA